MTRNLPWGVAAMTGMIRMSLDAPEETRPFEDGMGKLELVNLEAGPVGRATFLGAVLNRVAVGRRPYLASYTYSNRRVA